LNGLVGDLNGPDDTVNIPGPGWYSRTAYMRCVCVNSDMEVTDPAPDIATVILGRKMMTPVDGVWDEYQYTDNAAAVTRLLLTDPFYYKLDENWIDDDYATECFNYNAEPIFNTSLSDFLFVDEG
jgi:hypothetical protein